MKAEITNHARDAAICERTGTRIEACACGGCGQPASPDTKYAANRRDVMALLDLIVGVVDAHPKTFDKATWGHVGSISDLRGRLMEIAAYFALGRDGEDEPARRRVEEALCAQDERVADALIEATTWRY